MIIPLCFCVYAYLFAELYQPNFRVPVVLLESRDVLLGGGGALEGARADSAL